MRFFTILIFLIIHFISGAESGIEILKNGTFKSDSFWNLAVNGDASAEGTVDSNIYAVTLSSPGSEIWHIQLTQSNLLIKKDQIYILSFDIKSSQPRTIFTSVCKNRDDYLPYSIRDSLKVDTSFSRYIQHFQMIQPTDSFARIEFNLGKIWGNIKIKNISLIEYEEPKISFSSISPHNIAFIGEPIKLSWTSTGLTDTLKLSVSYDNGFSWTVIKYNLKSIDSLEWIPGSDLSPWCLFKLSTSKISVISTTAIQIVPKTELITNGSFRNTVTNWSLFTDTTKVYTVMSVRNSVLTITSTYPKTPAENVVKLSQNFIKINKGDQYELFFTCSAKAPGTLKVHLRDCKTEKEQSDTAYFAIDSTSIRQHVIFTAVKTVSNSEIQFIPDTSSTEISFSNISLVNISNLSAPVKNTLYTTHVNNQGQFRSIFVSGNTHTRISNSNSAIFDLCGRKIPFNSSSRIHHAFQGSLVVIVKSSKNQSSQITDTKQGIADAIK
ncbi:MAG TPA: carbohydrate binding domain-containing protein [Chitinispirillaceae bacterium]|nr:carbohydrate binding domain-containing protein [Chitinispirillaceae bacterium]